MNIVRTMEVKRDIIRRKSQYGEEINNSKINIIKIPEPFLRTQKSVIRKN